MKQEDKKLLLKDLCGRLPYGVHILYDNTEVREMGLGSLHDFMFDNAEVKPYLRSMSSMTEEEKKEFIHHASYEIEESVNGRHYEYYLKDYVGTPEEPTCNPDAIDWLNANHFDYRRLIKKGLALEAPEGMYNI